MCSALCRYVLLEWFRNGINGDAVGSLSRSSIAELVLNLVYEGESVDAFKVTMTRANKRCISERYFMNFKQALEHTTGTGFSLIALGGITGDGHAIICNGSKFAIFDPNVGYIKADSTSNYMWCFQSIIKEFYPNYLGGGRAVQVYEFA